MNCIHLLLWTAETGVRGGVSQHLLFHRNDHQQRRCERKPDRVVRNEVIQLVFVPDGCGGYTLYGWPQPSSSSTHFLRTGEHHSSSNLPTRNNLPVQLSRADIYSCRDWQLHPALQWSPRGFYVFTSKCRAALLLRQGFRYGWHDIQGDATEGDIKIMSALGRNQFARPVLVLLHVSETPITHLEKA